MQCLLSLWHTHPFPLFFLRCVCLLSFSWALKGSHKTCNQGNHEQWQLCPSYPLNPSPEASFCLCNLFPESTQPSWLTSSASVTFFLKGQGTSAQAHSCCCYLASSILSPSFVSLSPILIKVLQDHLDSCCEIFPSQQPTHSRPYWGRSALVPVPFWWQNYTYTLIFNKTALQIVE